jgi:hypothetical protein
MVNKWSTKRGAKVRQKMAITVGKYHLFERERRGQTYFYYWYEGQGKRIQKACGHDNTGSFGFPHDEFEGVEYRNAPGV